MLLNYVAVFGGLMPFLTVLGYWNEVDAFLDKNSGFGFWASIFHLFFAFLHYHSKAKLTQMRIDKCELNASDKNGGHHD